MSASVEEVKTRIVGLVWSKAEPAQAIIPLEYQAPLAGLFLSFAAIYGGLFTFSSGKQTVITALLAAVTLSFGAIFLLDAVRVYTG